MLVTAVVPQGSYKDQVVSIPNGLAKLTTHQLWVIRPDGLQEWYAIPMGSQMGIATPKRELRNVRYSGPRNPLVRSALAIRK